MPEIELPCALLRAFTGLVADRDVLVINRDPAPGEHNVPLTTAIALELAVIRGAGLVPESVRVSVDGALALAGLGAGIAARFAGPRSALEVRADLVRLVLDPVVPFESQARVTVRVEARTRAGLALDESYAFTAEDRTAPRLVAAVALSPTRVRLSFDEPVTAAVGAQATFDALDAPAVPLPTSAPIAGPTRSALDVELPLAMTQGARYRVTVRGVLDASGNDVAPPYDAAVFVGFAPQRPARRRFDLWSMLPKHNRARDESGDLARFIACLQEIVDLQLAAIDRMPAAVDLDRATEREIDSLLADLGSPFALELSEAQKRRLAASIVEMYRLKGTAPGIVRALRFFLEVEAEILPYVGTTLVLGESELDFDFILGPSARFARYAFDVRVTRVLSPSERSLLRQIVDYLKPAHTHFIDLIEPLPPSAFDHWELGESLLDEVESVLH